MGSDNRNGECITGKVRYADEENATAALERVKEARAARPDGKAPERIFYFCSECDGWHLSSRAPDLMAEHQRKGDGETWEEYAHRLERRIKEQRDQLAGINALRADAGNRHERKVIEGLRASLGRMTERWERERMQREGLVRRLAEIEKKVCA